MTVTLEQECTTDFSFDHKKLAEQVVLAALKEVRFPCEAEVSLLLVSTKEIQEINHEYREVDHPTDVLSFPMIAYHKPGDFSVLKEDKNHFNPETGEAILGDIVLCVPIIKEQAKAYGHSEMREYAFLILHSMLHLFGYDHMTEEESEVMEKKQTKLLDKLNILR